MNKRKVTVQYFACLVLVAIVAIEFIEDAAVAFWSTFSWLCPVLAQALRGWLPLGDQHRHRCRIFALLVTLVFSCVVTW